VAQNDAEDMRPPPLAVSLDDGRPGTEVDLSLLTGSALHPSEGERLGPAQPTDEPSDAVIRKLEAVVGHQILVNPLGCQALVQLGQDDLSQRLTLAGLA